MTLFYAKRGQETVFAKLGDHTDYGWRGKNASAEARTARRINNSVDGFSVGAPHWDTLRWRDPRELLNHPDLPELSVEAATNLLEELEDEANEPSRFEETYGISLMDVSDDDLDAYLADVQSAQDLLRGLAAKKMPLNHWVESLGPDEDFTLRDRVFTR